MFLLYAADKAAAAAAAAKKAQEDGVYFVHPFGFIIIIMVVITSAYIYSIMITYYSYIVFARLLFCMTAFIFYFCYM